MDKNVKIFDDTELPVFIIGKANYRMINSNSAEIK